jgi:integrase
MKSHSNVGVDVGASLTHTKALAIKPGDKPIIDANRTGLMLIAGTKKGRGIWNLRFTSPVSGKRRDMGLGPFPEVGIDQARALAREARKLIASKKDPLDERRLEEKIRQKQINILTFEKVARDVWMIRQEAWKNKKHIAQWINTLEQYVFPKIGNIDIVLLKPQDFFSVLSPIWLKRPETASRVRQRCNEIMKWAVASEYVRTNPVANVDTLLPKLDTPSKRHQPAMEWKKIPGFVQDHLRETTHISRIALEFLILTAARSGEVRSATWDEINLDQKVWTIPASKMKAKKVHRVPLSERAIEILKHQLDNARHATLVFPSPNGKIASDMLFTTFLRKHKIEATDVGVTATAHGFRSSFRDWASQNSYPRDLCERALAHSISNKTEEAYHRTDLLEERRPMMEAWSRFVSGANKLSP